jgi:hypothetical protein
MPPDFLKAFFIALSIGKDSKTFGLKWLLVP